VVLWDEIANTKFNDTTLISTLKDVMESGNMGRDGKTRMTECSLVFGGNIDTAPEGQGLMFPDHSVFRGFPKEVKPTDDLLKPPAKGFLLTERCLAGSE